MADEKNMMRLRGRKTLVSKKQGRELKRLDESSHAKQEMMTLLEV